MDPASSSCSPIALMAGFGKADASRNLLPECPASINSASRWKGMKSEDWTIERRPVTSTVHESGPLWFMNIYRDIDGRALFGRVR